NTHRGQLAEATDGQIFGHPAAEGAIAVAAVNVGTAGGGVFIGGAANPVEPFSSDGPRRIFFEADGTPVGVAAVDGPQPSEERDVPDIAAADGVTTATPGFNPFFGTSAAAPHAAGIAALIQQILSSLDSVGMSQRVKRDALDIEDPGEDQVSGSGIPKADDAIEGKQGFQGDTFSVKTKLGNSSTNNCFEEHMSGTGNNQAAFDALNELLDPYTNGTQPFVFEFETDPDNLGTDESLGGFLGGEEADFEATIGIESENGEDLFPEGFEDPKTGTPLDTACIEIGIDDTLDSDCPVDVTSAVMQFNTPTGPLFEEPLDITQAFSPNLFDGRARITVPNGVGQNVNGIVIRLTLQNPPESDIFADGFETGDAASWTDQVP
ncbi:MAG: S8 family serine peptidase, partial [Acidobacteriota bacterium]